MRHCAYASTMAYFLPEVKNRDDLVSKVITRPSKRLTTSIKGTLKCMPGSISVCTISPNFNLRSEEHTSELQSRPHLVCRLLLEKKKNTPMPLRGDLFPTDLSSETTFTILSSPFHATGCMCASASAHS